MTKPLHAGDSVLVTVPNYYTRSGIFRGYSKRGMAIIQFPGVKAYRYVAPHFMQRIIDH